jgi:DUF971 family protein
MRVRGEARASEISAVCITTPVVPACAAVDREQSKGNGRRFQGPAADRRCPEHALPEIWPAEIRLSKDRKRLTVTFDNGETHALDAEYLRVFSPSAEVQGHSPEQRVTVAGKQAVEILRVEPVGNYAVKLHFDDMHTTGIYAWGYLAKLGQERETLWRTYLDDLAEKGLSRAPRR